MLVSKNKTFDRVSLAVPVNSIEAFRKYSALRPALKAAASIRVLLQQVCWSHFKYQAAMKFSVGKTPGFAVGTASAVYVSKQLFSDKMKYFMYEGWRGKVMEKIGKHKA